MDIDTIQAEMDMDTYKHRFEGVFRYMKRSQKADFECRIAKVAFRMLARYVRARDNHRCFSCGFGGQRSLHAHHIEPRSTHPEKFWEEDNLITLCRFCHINTHGVEHFPYLSRTDVEEYYAECERRGINPFENVKPIPA